MTRDLARATEPRGQDGTSRLKDRHRSVAETIQIGAGRERDEVRTGRGENGRRERSIVLVKPAAAALGHDLPVGSPPVPLSAYAARGNKGTHHVALGDREWSRAGLP
jgi:hypothetical protein